MIEEWNIIKFYSWIQVVLSLFLIYYGLSDSTDTSFFSVVGFVFLIIGFDVLTKSYEKTNS